MCATVPLWVSSQLTSFRGKVADDADRFVFEANRPRQRGDAGINQPYERELIRKEPPSAMNECRTKRALATARWGLDHHRAAPPFDYCSMNDQKLMHLFGNAPVHAPFQKRHCQAQGHRMGRGAPIKIELRLPTQPATNTLRPVQTDMKIHKFVRVLETEISVQKLKDPGYQRQWCLNVNQKRACLQADALVFEPMRKLWG